jgi:hypothetical protein
MKPKICEQQVSTWLKLGHCLIQGNYSGLLKIAVSARAKRGLKRLESLVARTAHHQTG